MNIHLLTPTEADMMIWTAAGLCSLILLTRKFGWASIVSSLVVTELTTISVVVPILMLRAWSQSAYRPTAFAVGFGGMFVLGAIATFLERLRDDPQGTVGWAWKLFKGQGGEK